MHKWNLLWYSIKILIWNWVLDRGVNKRSLVNLFWLQNQFYLLWTLSVLSTFVLQLGSCHVVHWPDIQCVLPIRLRKMLSCNGQISLFYWMSELNSESSLDDSSNLLILETSPPSVDPFNILLNFLFNMVRLHNSLPKCIPKATIIWNQRPGQVIPRIG